MDGWIILRIIICELAGTRKIRLIYEKIVKLKTDYLCGVVSKKDRYLCYRCMQCSAGCSSFLSWKIEIQIADCIQRHRAWDVQSSVKKIDICVP
jgi:hypothetical protein